MTVERREQRIENRERGGFTLPELLVVIAIGILLLAIAVPAFTSVLYSSRRSGAAGAVETALAAARDVAVESGPGRDAAAVFFADSGGRLRIMVAVWAGDMADVNGRGDPVQREVFVRSGRVESITLPAGWAVSGRARVNMIDTEWYERISGQARYPDTDRDNWIYPETAFFDLGDGASGMNRQTFMVRFAGGSGAMTYGDDRAVLVVDPAPTRAFRSSSPWNDPNLMETADQRRFVQRVISRSDRFELLGDESSDTVLARPVGQVAVYSMKRLARGIGAGRLNPVTGSLYADEDEPKYDPSMPSDLSDRVNRWITGQAAIAGADADPDAQIFTVQRYLGRPLEAVAIGEAP